MIYYILGLLSGVIIMIFLQRKAYDGKLIINTSNPEKDIFRFEIDDLNHIDTKKELKIQIIKDSR